MNNNKQSLDAYLELDIKKMEICAPFNQPNPQSTKITKTRSKAQICSHRNGLNKQNKKEKENRNHEKTKYIQGKESYDHGTDLLTVRYRSWSKSSSKLKGFTEK